MSLNFPVYLGMDIAVFPKQSVFPDELDLSGADPGGQDPRTFALGALFSDSVPKNSS